VHQEFFPGCVKKNPSIHDGFKKIDGIELESQAVGVRMIGKERLLVRNYGKTVNTIQSGCCGLMLNALVHLQKFASPAPVEAILLDLPWRKNHCDGNRRIHVPQTQIVCRDVSFQIIA